MNKRFIMKWHGSTYKRCYFLRSNYFNGNMALVIMSDNECSPIGTATYNLGDILLQDEAYLKDNDGAEGVLETFKKIGIIKDILGWEQLSYTSVPKVKFNEIVLNEYCE